MHLRPGRARLALLLCSQLALSPGTARLAFAQDDEVISDPELGPSPRAKKRRKARSGRSTRHEAQQDATQRPDEDESDDERQPSWDAEPAQKLGSASDEEVISDPELESKAGTMSDDRGWGGLVPDTQDSPSASVDDAYDPLANTGIARLELIGQQGIDVYHEGDLEDAYESRLRFDAEVDFRRSRKLRMSVGLRTDLLWALPARGDPALFEPATESRPARQNSLLDADRWELDFIPLSAYVDRTFADSFHLRVGTQPVSVRRMDFFSAIDILAVYDMRGQPKLDPAAGRLAQPAVRVDWDLGSWATLQVVYVPWFMPNFTRPNRDRFVSSVLGTSGAVASRSISDVIDPSFQTQTTQAALRFAGPAPDFTTPQAQARLTMRGSNFELGLSGGTALEKLPSVYLTPAGEAFSRGDPDGQTEAANLVAGELPLVDIEYHRFATFGIDGSVDIAPLSLGFELAYSPSRHLNAATADGSRVPQPNLSEVITDTAPGSAKMAGNVLDKSIRKGVPLLQAAVHADWISGERFAIAVEAFMLQAMRLPYDETRDWWGFIPRKGIYAGGVLGGTFRPDPDAGRWRFDMSVIALVGPSYILMPQVEWKAVEGFYLNVGAQVFEGPRPIVGGAQSVTVGGLFQGYDQVFVGFRYLP